jgi:hypothetical protein
MSNDTRGPECSVDFVEVIIACLLVLSRYSIGGTE